MSSFEDAVIQRIKQLEREVERLQRWERPAIKPVFLTTPKTSTSWDGDTKTTSDRAIVDLSTVFGVPAGIKAVLMGIQTQADAVDEYIRFGPNSTYNYALTCRTPVAGQIAHATGVVPCDSNGDIYCFTSLTDVENVYVWIWGYWL